MATLERGHFPMIEKVQVEPTWNILHPLLREPSRLHPYPQGSWGPAQAERLGAAIGGWSNPLATRREGA